MAINCNAKPTNHIENDNHEHTLMMGEYFDYDQLEKEEEALLEQESQAMSSEFWKAIRTNDPKIGN